MLNESQYEMAYSKCAGATIDALWSFLDPVHQSWTGLEKLELNVFLQRREVFLWVLERLLKDGRIKLHKADAWLEGSVEEQVQMFRQAWPETEKASGYEDFYWWFFDPDCPAGVAWRQSDGRYVVAN